MRTLTFNRSIGAFKKGETYEVENNITADFFLNNAFASEDILDEGCKDCKPTVVNKEETIKEVKKTKK